MDLNHAPRETFPESGLPNYLEGYSCYDDPSCPYLIDGRELRNNTTKWTDQQKAWWHYFYQVVPEVVGYDQRGLIRLEEFSIAARRRSLAEAASGLRFLLVLPGIPDLFLILYYLFMTLASHRIAAPLHLLFAGAGLPVALFLLMRIRNYRSLKEKLSRDNANSEERVKRLKAEIEELKRQIPHLPNKNQLTTDLSAIMQELERECLAKIQGLESTNPLLFETLRHTSSRPPNPYDLKGGLLVQGWAPLQPRFIRTPAAKESSGLDRVARALGARTATFRSTDDGELRCRVTYLQFIFLMRKNISVYSFFFDLVTRRRFGQRSESFQYNHVSNFTITDVEMTTEESLRADLMPPEMISHFSQKDFSAFTVCVSSGSSFRCVVADERVLESLNEWLDLARDDKDNDSSAERPPSQLSREDREPWKAAKEQDASRINQARQQLKRRLEEKTSHWAQLVLLQIRHEIEGYVQQVQTVQRPFEPVSRPRPYTR